MNGFFLGSFLINSYQVTGLVVKIKYKTIRTWPVEVDHVSLLCTKLNKNLFWKIFQVQNSNTLENNML